MPAMARGRHELWSVPETKHPWKPRARCAALSVPAEDRPLREHSLFIALCAEFERPIRSRLRTLAGVDLMPQINPSMLIVAKTA
jgi:hypothetical protein